jgi:hypothetical protein
LLLICIVIRYQSRNYDTEPQPRDPITGGGVAILGSIGDVILNVADIKLDMQSNPQKSSSQVSPTDTKSPAPPIPDPATEMSGEIRTGFPEALEFSSMAVTSPNRLESFVEEELPGREYGILGNTDNSQEGCLSTEDNPAHSPVETGSVETPQWPSQPQADASGVIPETNNVEFDTIIKVGRTATKILNMSLRVPMEFTVGVAKGFHNAPLLYGDDSVREMQSVTGIKSGLKAAGKVCLAIT